MADMSPEISKYYKIINKILCIRETFCVGMILHLIALFDKAKYMVFEKEIKIKYEAKQHETSEEWRKRH